MAQGITLASTTISAAIDLNPALRQTTMQLTTTSGSSGTISVQVSLDDPASLGAPAFTWGTLASFQSSAIDGAGGQTLSIYSPVSAVRMFAASSTTSGVVGTTTLKVLQNVTG
jgi:hypothetical protein